MNSAPFPQGRRLNRRQFLQQTGLTVMAGTLASPAATRGVAPASGQTLRIGLIGCGGRGSGAAAQALTADANLKLVAMGDAFPDQLKRSLETLKKQPRLAERVEVPEEHCFVGFDAYLKVIEQSDVVLLTTPPHFRPLHLEAAVAAGKHVFAEKPVAVDAPGVRRVLAACEQARQKGLSVVSGLQMRYSLPHQEMIGRVHDGALGEIRTLQANDFRGPLWVRKRQPGWTDMEYHMRNWYYFTWLSGDFNVEQHVHMLDVCAWIMKDEHPVRAYGTGGRQVRVEPEYGNIYDHHSVVYEYESGTRLFAACRQMAGCMNDISVSVAGARGTGTISGRRMELTGDAPWVYEGERNNAQQTEHDELFASIRAAQPINNGEYMSKSTLLAVMGRMATYTGQAISWEQALNSEEDLSPERYAWDAPPPHSPVAIPGLTRFAGSSRTTALDAEGA